MKAARRSAPAGKSRRPSLVFGLQFAVPRAGLPVRSTLRRWALAALDRDATVTLRFVGASEGRRLNANYRGRDYPTNVLTFVYDAAIASGRLAGDIVLCVPVLRREARAQQRSLRAHCAHLVIHGMLHLQGYDHERSADALRMEARETELLARLGYADPYADPCADSNAA